MSATALRERLASLSGGRPRTARPRPEPRIPRGFEPVETPHGTAWRLADVLPVGRVAGPPPEPHVYFDTETTGVAGGTGTHVFAAAVCLLQDAGLEVTQLFLPEPAAEPAFLCLLQQELTRAARVATYNGGRFDLPLLRTRWVLARMPGDFEHPEHLDLLTMTRALLGQRLESCTLRTVEERVLGFERDGDLPGALVPDAYLTYLRRGWSPLLEPALSHNRQDVVSLFYLHARLQQHLRGGDARMRAADWLALGRHLVRTGRRADGWRALRHAAAAPDELPSPQAGLLLARRLTRLRSYGGAERLLAGLQQRLPEDPDVAIARARLLEWRLHDLRGALEVVDAALLHVSPRGPQDIDLRHRRARLERRLARARRT